jgi:hypothetical protein
MELSSGYCPRYHPDDDNRLPGNLKLVKMYIYSSREADFTL